MTTATDTKTYTKSEMINHFFQNAYALDDAFVQLPGQSTYQLVYDLEENELERMMRKREIVNYVTLEHILSIISEIENFLTPQQLEVIGAEIETFE